MSTAPVHASPTAPAGHPPRWPYVIVSVVHLLGALTGPAYYLYATSVPVIGANIGAGLALMWTAGWGLPWSLLPWNDALTSNSTNDQDLVAFAACALFNVALVAGALFMLYRRARKRLQEQSDGRSVPQRWHYALVPLVALASVAAGQLYFLLSFLVPMPGEDVGIGTFAGYWTALVGLPWTIWVEPTAVFGFGLEVCAMLNIGIVSLIFWLAYRRARRRDSAPAS